MKPLKLRSLLAFLSLATILALSTICRAQAAPDNQSWSASSLQQSPDGHLNPTRTSQTHTEVDGRIVNKTTVERLGPDGRYVLFSETEKESVRVNDTTVLNVERSFGSDSNGNPTLIQETQEESRRLPGGEERITRTDSRPDANGRLQVVRRELEDSKQASSNVRVTNTTVLLTGANGLPPAVQTEQRETKSSDGGVQSTKSTFVADGNGRWQLGEVRESTTKQGDGGASSTEQRVLRPDSNGHLSVVERTVERQKQVSGEKRDTTETYSTNVPGQAGDDRLQLVERATTVQQTSSKGGQSTTQRVERPSPGAPSAGLQVTQEALDILRPSGSGASETRTVLAPDANGNLDQVWVDIGKTGNLGQVRVDMGKTGNPAAIQVDTKSQVNPR